MLKIGLTGNIASGKSEVEKIISSLGYEVVDLDIVSHNLLESNTEVQKKVISEFNTLNRKEIGRIVFSSEEKRKILENIIYPELNKFIDNFFYENKDKEAVFISGATIFESGFDKIFDKILLIDAPLEIKLKRLVKRDNLSIHQAQKRLDCQKNNLDKTNFIIINDSDFKELEKKVKNILKTML